MKYALRSLAKSPGFTAIALLTLALGIGANTAIFSLVQSVLLRPLPYPHQEQLLAISENQRGTEGAPLSWSSLQDYQRDNRTFTALAGFRRGNYTLTGAGEPELLASAQVTASFFSVIGLPPRLGRYFTADEDKPGAPGLIVLTDGLWQRRFGADPSVIGRVLTLNGEMFTVIGVLTPEFATPANVDFLTMLGRASGNPGWQNRGHRPNIFALGRMKPGVTPAEAIVDLKRISARIELDDPQSSAGVSATGRLLFDQTVGSYRQGLWLLLGAVALVLLIACANLANLLLARGSAREAEFAVRAALGASRGKIIRQLMLENALLALGGGTLGLLFATWAHSGIAALSPAGVSRFQEAGIDGGVLAATAGLSLFAVFAFGLWPAWKGGQVDLRTALQAGGRTGSGGGPGATRARETLIVAEVALTLVLLVGAGLLLKSFARARAVDLGIDPRGVLTARIALPYSAYDSPEKADLFNQRLLARLAAAPGITAAAFTMGTPLNGGFAIDYAVEGQPEPAADSAPTVELNAVTGDYFRTLGIPLLRGRTFGAEDGLLPPDRSWGIPPSMTAIQPTATPVIVIDQAFADRHWPGEDPIGQHIRLGEPISTLHTVIGVVPTVRLSGYRIEPSIPQAYTSIHQRPGLSSVLLLRGTGQPAALVDAIRQALREIDPNQPLSEVRLLEERVEATFGSARLYTFLLSIFAGLALLLAAIGLYGVLAYQVNRRTREFGIRIALGALRTQLVQLVLRRGLRLVGTGVVLGLMGAFALGRVLGSLLYQTSAFDAGVIAAVTGLLALVALLASWLPARRAARVDPMTALRAE